MLSFDEEVLASKNAEVENDVEKEVENSANATNDARNGARNGVNSINDAKNDARNDARNAEEMSLEERVVELVRSEPLITKVEMAERMGVSKSTIERMLKKTKLIKHVGPNKGGHWEVSD